MFSVCAEGENRMYYYLYELVFKAHKLNFLYVAYLVL